MVRIAVCDDDNAICSQIESIILEYSGNRNIGISVDVFYDGNRMLDFICNEYSFDIIFLDIEMGGINGVDVGRDIRVGMNNQTVQIVYISAKTDYCMELFEIRPMNFLEKPLTAQKIIDQVSLAINLSSKSEYIFRYKQGHTSYSEPVKNIILFESHNRMVKMLTTSGEVSIYSTLATIEQQLAKNNFLFIHKSFLVNYAHVIELGSKELKMSNNQILVISQNRRKAVKEAQIKLEKETFRL